MDNLHDVNTRYNINIKHQSVSINNYYICNKLLLIKNLNKL